MPSGGDIWFGTAYNYSLAALGNYYFATALHELGHALGLKHSQETGGVANVAVPAAHDDSEYTVMSYRSYVGAPLTGYTNEAYGYPQTYMANDILALQTLYGANYSTHSENTVYSWSPTTGQEFINGVAQLAPGNGVGGSANRVFETIWDGNGVDTYDLSNYTTAVTINLNPGASSITSSTQLAYLGNGHYAAGNIYNAYLFNDDARSYIDNAIGGSGNDTIIGNAIANTLNGGNGNDTLTGGGGQRHDHRRLRHRRCGIFRCLRQLPDQLQFGDADVHRRGSTQRISRRDRYGYRCRKFPVFERNVREFGLHGGPIW